MDVLLGTCIGYLEPVDEQGIRESAESGWSKRSGASDKSGVCGVSGAVGRSDVRGMRCDWLLSLDVQPQDICGAGAKRE